MERLPTVGDLVRLKKYCRRLADDDRVYLVSGKSGEFFRLHGEEGLIAAENFILVGKAK